MSVVAVRPVRGVGLAATVLIGLVAVVKILAALFQWLTVEASEYTPLGVVVAGVLSWIWLVAFLVAALTFMLWMKDARFNADAITSPHQHRYQKMWVFVGWLIPIANLFIPYTVMQDVWRGSDRSQPMVGLQQRPRSGLVKAWWICFLISNFSLTLPPKYAYEIAAFATFSALMSVVAALLATRMIKQVNEMQMGES